MISNDIDLAVRLLKKGDVVAIPTETVYGLAANVYNPEAIEKIFAVKQRPKNDPLIVHVSNIMQLEDMVGEIPYNTAVLYANFWPGPMTILFKNNKNICVLMFDLDNFKHINDTYGHLEGDKALLAASKVLKNVVKDTNVFLARFGGDEFIIIAKDYSEDDINSLISKIEEETKLINQKNTEYIIGISCGYAFLEKDEDVLNTIERADQKLYERKKEKKTSSY